MYNDSSISFYSYKEQPDAYMYCRRNSDPFVACLPREDKDLYSSTSTLHGTYVRTYVRDYSCTSIYIVYDALMGVNSMLSLND